MKPLVTLLIVLYALECAVALPSKHVKQVDVDRTFKWFTNVRSGEITLL